MPPSDANDNNFESIKSKIDKTYELGHFVAIDSGQVIADAPTHRQLVKTLEDGGKRANNMLIVQAGVAYPDSATILLNWRDGDA